MEKIIDNQKILGVPSEFDQEYLMGFVEKYSFPRCIGTEGERKVRKMIFKEFNELGFKAYKEEFVCSLAYSKLLLPLSMIFFLVLLLTTQIIKFFFPEFDEICDLFFILGFFAGFIYIFRKIRKPQKFLAGKIYHSANIFSFIPANQFFLKENGIYDDVIDGDIEDNCGNIIISAHSDSKSQVLKTKTRIKIFEYSISILLLLFLGWIIAFSMNILHNLQTQFKYTTFFSISITVTIFFLTITLIINRSGNESPGALDNASGMAVVFALANYFKNQPLENYNLWFVQFGVEEFGQPGSRHFILKRLRRFKRDQTFNFNLDMVGEKSDEKLYIYEFQGRKPIDPLMMQVIRECADELDLEIYGFNLRTGARTDRKVFTTYGFHGIDFVSFNAGKWTHSSQDTIDKVNPSILANACRIISLCAKKIDESFKKEQIKESKHIRQGYL